MLKVERTDDTYRITGLPNGRDWLFRPPVKELRTIAAAGHDRVWFADYEGNLRIMDANTRKEIAALRVESERSANPHPHLTAPDGRHLFYLAHGERVPGAGVLHLIDLATGTTVRTHSGMPFYSNPPMIQRADGRLVLCSGDYLADVARQRLTVLDPFTGEREDQLLPDPEGDFDSHFFGRQFQSISPQGRYLLRFDHTRFPMRPGADGLPEFGLSFQLWKTDPLRCVGRMVVRWAKLTDLPNRDKYERVQGSDGRWMYVDVPPTEAFLAMWTALSQLLTRLDLAPNDAFPPRSAFPEPLRSDDTAWTRFATYYREILELRAPTDLYVQAIRWQPDEQAFWLQNKDMLSCVGLDSSLSPSWVAAHPKAGDMDARLDMNEVEVLPDRKARVTFKRSILLTWVDRTPTKKAQATWAPGVAVIDGAAVPAPPAGPVRIGDLIPVQDAEQARKAEQDRADLRARLQAEQAARRDLTIDLAAWREAEVIAAIDGLAGHMAPELLLRAVEGSIDIGFRSGAKRIGEEAFFLEAARAFPAALPAVARLVERFCAAMAPDGFLFGDGANGIGLLASAVRTLGVHDLAALPLVMRYGMLVDRGHEYEFAGRTAHAVVAAHGGWTPKTVVFAFWLIERDFYNALPATVIWSDWGLDEAVAKMEPEGLARTLHGIGYGTSAPPGSEVPSGFDKLQAAVGDAGPWERRFFAALRGHGGKQGITGATR